MAKNSYSKRFRFLCDGAAPQQPYPTHHPKPPPSSRPQRLNNFNLLLSILNQIITQTRKWVDGRATFDQTKIGDDEHTLAIAPSLTFIPNVHTAAGE